MLPSGTLSSGSLDRLDFAAVNFNEAGARPPTPEPSSALLMIPGLVLAGVQFAKGCFLPLLCNSDVNSWNSGPLGLVAFNNDISAFDAAADAFNTATSGSYATVLQVSPYGSVSRYEVGNFDSGSLDRPDFASAVASFNIAAVNFNVAGASPPVSLEPSPVAALEKSE